MISDHPPWQHVGWMVWHWHFFCHITNPMPVWLQSVTMHVHASNLKEVTPSATSLIISTFAVSKDCWRSSVQRYSVFLASSLRKGSIRVVFEKEKATCSTRPNQDLIPVKSVGLGKLEMADNVSSVDFTPSCFNQNPTS